MGAAHGQVSGLIRILHHALLALDLLSPALQSNIQNHYESRVHHPWQTQPLWFPSHPPRTIHTLLFCHPFFCNLCFVRKLKPFHPKLSIKDNNLIYLFHPGMIQNFQLQRRQFGGGRASQGVLLRLGSFCKEPFNQTLN